jgi:hypothetical protein
MGVFFASSRPLPPFGSIAIVMRVPFVELNENLEAIKRNETMGKSTLYKSLFLCQGAISFPSFRGLSPRLLHKGD